MITDFVQGKTGSLDLTKMPNLSPPDSSQIYSACTIRLACFEDGLDNIGFRKISSFIKSIHSDTTIAYVPTGSMRGIVRTLMGKGAGDLTDNDIRVVAKFLAEGDLVGLSSMTQYSSTVHKIIDNVRILNPDAFIVWGGIHAIIYPEDAIKYADAVCTGEGEYAFKHFLELFKDGRDYLDTPGFWFRTANGIVKNSNLPLMEQEDLNSLPYLTYQDSELIYHWGEGFKPIEYSDFVRFTGLSYNTVWSIGCPFECTYCGNTKFIEYDNAYRRLRHSSPATIINEVKRAIYKHPHISVVLFHDDSFLALRYKILEEFAELWKSEVNIPFAVFGVIPNYVRDAKIALLLDAGLNRIRMGIQSGSEDILKFYKRPTPLPRIRDAMKILNRYHKHMIPPAYDIILENPVEKPEDTRATLDLLYEMPRPFTLNVFALRVIPNTSLADDFEKKGLEVPPIDKDYLSGYRATLGNVLVFALVVWKIPNWIFRRLRSKVFPAHAEQPLYPIMLVLFRTAYLVKRAIDHIKFMDFSVLPGKFGYYLWKVGVVRLRHRHVLKRYRLANEKFKLETENPG
jgi:radical SAM superfamily enzyme YgiQ (UPF0313 family)